MRTTLIKEQMDAVVQRAATLRGAERERYLAGVRDGLDLVCEGVAAQDGTLAGGIEIQAFYDYLDGEGIPVLSGRGEERPAADTA
jgi:hypothetical protein